MLNEFDKKVKDILTPLNTLVLAGAGALVGTMADSFGQGALVVAVLMLALCLNSYLCVLHEREGKTDV
jgi:hypothetical protein